MLSFSVFDLFFRAIIHENTRMMKVYIFISSVFYTVPVVFFARNVIHEFQRQKMLGLSCKAAFGMSCDALLSHADVQML
jgi:hypothetical protein